MTDSEKLDMILSNMQKMQADIADISSKVKKIELTLENETNVNIKRIAEGHLDLSRKLNEAIKISSDIQAKQELQDIYINMHESKLKVL